MKSSFTKKQAIIIALVIAIIGLCYYYIQKRLNDKLNNETVTAYRSQSNALLGDAEWLSFDMQWDQYSQGKHIWSMTHHVTMHYGHGQDMVFVDDPFHYKFLRITKSSADVIDCGENKIITYKRKFGGRYFSVGIEQHLFYYNEYLWYYMMPLCNRFSLLSSFILEEHKDLYNGNDSLREYIGHDAMIGYSENDSTGKWDVPNTQKVFSYVNSITNVLDSIKIDYYVGGENTSQRIIRISNLRYDNRQRYIDSIFNLDNPRYAKFSHHDEKNPEDPWSDNKSVTEELANYSLVNLEGDTTTIAENDGWLLLNFWTINCAPCIQHLKDYKHEKDSLGYRILENEGIRILAINQKSDNMELMADIAEKTDTRDIMYSGKGIGGTIELPYLGYFYLISPDKEVVYDSSNLGDYSELLKAKADYEKQHQKE